MDKWEYNRLTIATGYLVGLKVRSFQFELFFHVQIISKNCFHLKTIYIQQKYAVIKKRTKKRFKAVIKKRQLKLFFFDLAKEME